MQAARWILSHRNPSPGIQLLDLAEHVFSCHIVIAYPASILTFQPRFPHGMLHCSQGERGSSSIVKETWDLSDPDFSRAFQRCGNDSDSEQLLREGLLPIYV